MRTFSEYILESRQKYIFGGTDDRNTDASALKTFRELEVGDMLYFFNDTMMEKPVKLPVTEIVGNKISCSVNDDTDLTIRVEKDEEGVSYFEHPYRYGNESDFNAYGTDEEEFIDSLKRNHNLHFSPDDIGEEIK